MLNKNEINTKCNEISKNGGEPFALYRASKELKERPADGWDIVEADETPEVEEIYSSKEEAIAALKAKGTATVNPFRSAGGTCYDCAVYFVEGMVDEIGEGEDWAPGYDGAWEVSELPEETEE